jgi:hypothetical protein
LGTAVSDAEYPVGKRGDITASTAPVKRALMGLGPRDRFQSFGIEIGYISVLFDE